MSTHPHDPTGAQNRGTLKVTGTKGDQPAEYQPLSHQPLNAAADEGTEIVEAALETHPERPGRIPSAVSPTLADDDDVIADVLPCGRDLDELLEQVFTNGDHELDDHQSHCEHCQAVLAETSRRWAPLRSAGTRLETAPPGLRQAVMSAVRRLANRQWAVILHQGAEVGAGTLRISTAVVVAVAEHAAARVPGVRRAWARAAPEAPLAPAAFPIPGAPGRGWVSLTGHGDADAGTSAVNTAPALARASAPGGLTSTTTSQAPAGALAGPDPTGAGVVVQLLVVADYGSPLVPLARAARQAISRELIAVTSLLKTRIDIHVADVKAP